MVGCNSVAHGTFKVACRPWFMQVKPGLPARSLSVLWHRISCFASLALHLLLSHASHTKRHMQAKVLYGPVLVLVWPHSSSLGRNPTVRCCLVDYVCAVQYVRCVLDQTPTGHTDLEHLKGRDAGLASPPRFH